MLAAPGQWGAFGVLSRIATCQVTSGRQTGKQVALSPSLARWRREPCGGIQSGFSPFFILLELARQSTAPKQARGRMPNWTMGFRMRHTTGRSARTRTETAND